MEISQLFLLNSPQCVLGIDPGLSGAVAKIGRGSFYLLRDFKHLSEIALSVQNLCHDTPAPDFAVLEHVHAFPGQGVCSCFSFGEANGAALGGLALCLPAGASLIKVEPQVWQKWFRERLSIPKAQEFDSRLIAARLLPAYADRFERKKDHNSADATLIAIWGLLKGSQG